MESFSSLRDRIKSCTVCAEHLPLGPRPVLQINPSARILVVGQAPGIRVHKTGLPFNDPSGDRLRDWMEISRETFYDAKQLAIVPMGFCYPGTGKSGDLPPRPECAETWREVILNRLENIELTIIMGQYALKWHLGKRQRKNLTETVKAWREFFPDVLPLPHPSPRNNMWLRKNPWFEKQVVKALRKRVGEILS